MKKTELVRKLAAANPQLRHDEAERIVAVLFEHIIAALARGERVELRGFGTFSVRHREARRGLNPRTGASVAVSEKYVPSFRAGKALRNRVNQTD
jgi:integration host factor subunit beta